MQCYNTCKKKKLPARKRDCLLSGEAPRRISEACTDCAFPNTVWGREQTASGCSVQDACSAGRDLGKMTSFKAKDPNSCS